MSFIENSSKNIQTIKDSFFLTKGKMYKILEETLMENMMLNDKVEKLDKLAENISKENGILSDRIEDLEIDLEVYERNEVKEKDTESDLYMETMLANALDKTTEERTIYKETINRICKKYNIDHAEVFDMIDQIKQERKQEYEKSLS